jgi:hypothetical protein
MRNTLASAFVTLLLINALPLSAAEPEAASFETDSVNPFADSRRPITNSVYFDLTIPQTQIRPLFLQHSFPGTLNTIVGPVRVGGDAQLYALQIEIALSDRISINAIKDGYVSASPDATLSSQEGFANLAAGIKYAWLLEPEQGLASNVQLIFEAPTGNSDVFQGEGDGVFIPSASVMKMWNRWQFVDQIGFKLPVDGNAESTSMFNSFHASYQLFDWLFPTFEANWWRVLDAGNGQPNFAAQAGGAVPAITTFEGNDLFNFGAVNAEQNRDLVTLGVGFRARLQENLDVGFGFEFPVSNKNDSLIENRFVLDAVIRF